MAQCWRRAAANDGMPFLGPKMVVNGWWSVMSVKSRPNRY